MSAGRRAGRGHGCWDARVRRGRLRCADGPRLFVGTLLALLGWTVLFAVVVAVVSVWRDVALGVVEAGLILACTTEMAQAARREVVLAVHRGGVYFGSGLVKDVVPWSKICAVEFFTEIVSRSRSRSAYRFLGVRAPGAGLAPRPGSGPGDPGGGPAGQQFMVDSGQVSRAGADSLTRSCGHWSRRSAASGPRASSG